MDENVKVEEGTISREEILENPEKYIMVYKISNKLYSLLETYLNTRPMIEVNVFFDTVFNKNVNRIIDYYDMNLLLGYMVTKCPRIDVIDIISKINNQDHVEQLALNIEKNAEYAEHLKKKLESYNAGSDFVKSMINGKEKAN